MKRPIEIEDLARIKYLSDPNITPDGTRIAYVVTEIDLPGKRYQSAIWVAAADGTGRQQFTSGRTKDTSPRWSPDGERLAFLSDRDDPGTSQLYVIAANGGEAERITDLKYGVADPVWSPSGQEIIVVAQADHDGIRIIAEETEEDRKREKEQSDVKIVRRLKYKLEGEGFLTDRRRHLVLLSLTGERPRQITFGDWNDTQPAWSPYGDVVAFASNRTDDRDLNTIMDIWVAPLSGGDPWPVTASDGSYGTPAFAPDGRSIAFTGNRFHESYGSVTVDSLWQAPVNGGEAVNLSASLDRDIGSSVLSDAHYGAPVQRPVWDEQGDAIYALVSSEGNVSVHRFSPEGDVSAIVTGERVITNFSRARSGSLAVLASTPVSPPEVFLIPNGDQGEIEVSQANVEWRDAVDLNDYERLQLDSADGQEIDGWLLKPAGFRPGQRYPLILQIHGGPHAMYGNTYFHEMQVLAAQGYVVLMTNPRGSTGYGQEFLAGALGDWGGVDFQDLMSAVDQVVASGSIDEQRLGVTGGSYGGYMTNWIITQSKRFKAAIADRSTCNRHNLFGTSDLVWSFAPYEFAGTAYDKRDFYLERSPLLYVQEIETPLLLMHSEGDLRCPIEQAEQFFVALKLHRKTVEFIRFPNENHNLSRGGRPDHRIERLEHLIRWFHQHL